MKCHVCNRNHPLDENKHETIWKWHLRHRLSTDTVLECEFLEWSDYVEAMTP